MSENYSNMNIDDNKKKVLSNIIGINPTGTVNYEGTYSLKGNNNIIMNPDESAKISLEKAQNNEINCSNLEKFDNQFIVNDFKIRSNYSGILALLLFLFIIIIIFILIFKYSKK
jgi:hypothetical protein